MSPDRDKAGDRPPLSPATVVIVMGDEAERTRLAHIVRAAGHEVILFQTAQQALEHLAPPPRTVLILDCLIDEMSTTSLINALHERGVYLPTLVTVPSFGIHDAVDAMRHKAADVLEQPLGPARFLQSIAAALDRGGGSAPDHE